MQIKLLISDTVVKAVFDHFRNLGIVGAVFVAAAWAYNNAGHAEILPWMDTVAWICLVIVGTVLFLMNEIHAHRKLDKSGIPLVWEMLIRMVYTFSVFYFVISFVAPRIAAG